MSNINIVVAAQVQDAVSGLNQVNQATKRVGDQVNKATSKLKSHTNQYNRTAVATNKWAKGALQQAGYQVGDFAVQVANGTSGIQAFGQQGSQLLGVFGPIGAVLGAGVAIFSALALAAERSGASVGSMTSALGVLEQPLKTAIASLSDLRETFGSVGAVLVQNIDTAIISVGLFAGVMGVKYVASVVAASMATVSFTSVTAAATGAVVALTRALMRFLPVAVLIGVAKLIEMFLQLMKGAEGFGNAIDLLTELFSAAFEHMVGSTNTLKLQFQKVKAQIMQVWYNMLASMQLRYSQFLANVSSGINKIPTMEGIAAGISDAASQASALYVELTAVATGMENAVSNAQRQIDEAGEKSSERLRSAWEALKEAFKNGRTEIDGLGGAISQTIGKDLPDTLTDAQKRTMDIANSIQTNMSSAFMSMVDGTKSVKTAFKDMARSIIAKLYEVLVVQRIVNAAMGLFGFSQNPSGQWANWSNPFGGGKAIGGPVQAGKPYVVGERGPEMFVPSRSGSIIPNDKMSSGGNVIVNQTINVSTGVQQTVRTEIKSLMPQIAESAKAAVADAKRRGGSYGRAFA